MNRQLAPRLVVESGLALYAGIEAFVTVGQPTRPAWAAQLGEYGVTALLLALPILYLRVLATLDTPMTAWLQRKPIDRALLALLVLLVAVTVGGYFSAPLTATTILVPIGMAGVAVYGIAAAVSFYRRTVPGSARRAQHAHTPWRSSRGTSCSRSWRTAR